jgi:hypothetical protein
MGTTGTPAVSAFEFVTKNVVSTRLQQQPQSSLNWMHRSSSNIGVQQRQFSTAAITTRMMMRFPQPHKYPSLAQVPSATRLYYYNPQYQRHNRDMSKITEAKNVERMRKKYEEEQKRGRDSKNKKEKKEPYDWLPFWTTPERDPYDSIYIQDPIAEQDCTPLRLYIPTEVDMLEIGTMCAMLFFTTPDLDTYESMPNNGDVIFLKGDLGSGKSVFARGFIRGALGDWKMDVPSPTYLLSNTYHARQDKGSNKDIEYVLHSLYMWSCTGCISKCFVFSVSFSLFQQDPSYGPVSTTRTCQSAIFHVEFGSCL